MTPFATASAKGYLIEEEQSMKKLSLQWRITLMTVLAHLLHLHGDESG